MTGYATRGYSGVIHRNRSGAGKGRRRFTVTIVAHIGRRRMCGAFGATHAARGMAVHAGASYHLRMINDKRGKARRRDAMASFARFGGLRMG